MVIAAHTESERERERKKGKNLEFTPDYFDIWALSYRYLPVFTRKHTQRMVTQKS